MTRIANLVLVDDNPIDQLLYRRMIERTGKVDNLQEFMSPDHAIAYFQDNPDASSTVVFLDINMPRTDGFEFLEMLADNVTGAKVPVVVMLTSSLNPQDKARAANFPMVKEFLHKPLRAADIERIANAYGVQSGDL